MLLEGADAVLYVSSDVLLHLNTEVLKNLSVVMYEVWAALYKRHRCRFEGPKCTTPIPWMFVR